jgi:TetR/AcrR family transcriptional repressor of nem operon
MSRPKNPDIIRTRLLDVGLAAFAKRGYHGTGIKEIVDTANVPKGSFYNYFKSKEDYGIAIVHRHSAEFWQKWQTSVTETPDNPLQVLRGCFSAMLTEHIDCSVNTFSVVAHLAAEVCETSPECRSLMTTILAEWQENLACFIARAQQAGQIRTDIEAHQLATLFWDAWQGAILRMKMQESAEPVKQLVDLMLDAILKP